MSSSRVSDSFLAGCVSGCVSRSVIEPLDVLKIRFQLQYEPVRKVGELISIKMHFFVGTPVANTLGSP